MIIPIKCYTCGNVLGSKFKKYNQLMNTHNLLLKNNKIYLPSETSKTNNTIEITPENRKKIAHDFFLKNGTQQPIESLILNKIGLKRYCCRRIMISHVETY